MRRATILIFLVVSVFGASTVYFFAVRNKHKTESFESKLYKSILILHQARFLCPKSEEVEIDMTCLCHKHELMNKQIDFIEQLMREHPNFNISSQPLHDTKAAVDVIYDIDVIRSLRQELGFCDE